MNTKVIAVIVGAIVVLGGGVYFVTKNNTNSQSNNQTTSDSSKTSNENAESNNQDEGSDVQGSLQSLSGGGKALECTMNYGGEEGIGSGKMYTAGDGRGFITLELTTDRGNSGTSNTLITADKAYSWTVTDGGSFGLVFDKSAIQSTGSPATSSTAAAGKDFSMKCKGWKVDETKLTVPSDVKFSEIPGTTTP